LKIFKRNHLCYSLNVYPAESWAALFDILREKGKLIRKFAGQNSKEPFALGLWLNSRLVSDLVDSEYTRLDDLKKLLLQENFYIFTVNAFPYGKFHGERIKENVYRPDWTNTDRLDYTCRVADILAELLPEKITGSISSLPGSYQQFIIEDEQIDIIAGNIILAGEHLRKIELDTGKRIILGLEMEPDCLWESPAEFILFYQKYISKYPEISKYIGICYDCCHQELICSSAGEGIRLFLEAGIPIAKIHLSSAVAAMVESDKEILVTNFADEVYLHQTRIDTGKEEYLKYPDLPEALAHADRSSVWITHFHVPVYCEDLEGGLIAEKKELRAVIELLKADHGICANWEIETYTYSVLPQRLKQLSLEESIGQEYHWLLKRLLKCENSLQQVPEARESR